MENSQSAIQKLNRNTQNEKAKNSYRRIILKKVRKNYQLYLFLLPAIIYIAVFLYAPMYGILIAFKDYKVKLGILHSPWVGLRNFMVFFNSYSFGLTIKNTLILSFYKLLAGFPLPIILAILLHHLPSKRYKKNCSDGELCTLLYFNGCISRHD